MMLDAFLILAAAFSIYPLGMLWIAATGPHSRFEREDMMRNRWQSNINDYRDAGLSRLEGWGGD